MNFSKVKYIYLCFTVFFSYSCAIIKAPKGGPKDETPPEIISSYPSDGTSNFKEKKIELEFSEYVNKQSVYQNLFITPEIEFDYKWNRKKLSVNFLDELNPDYTYTVTIGSDATDLHGNKLNSSFSLVLSSGSKIDTGIITGKVHGIKFENPFVFAYSIANPDTLNILESKPKYKIPIGKSGEFQIKALKDGKYRIIAISDIFKDGIYDIDVDGFAAATKDFTVKNGKSETAIIKAGTVIDTISPKLIDVNADYNNILIAQFNEGIPEKYLMESKVFFSDSIAGEELIISSVWSKEGEHDKLYILPESPMDSNRTHTIQIETVKDSSGNIIDRNNNKTHFIPSGEKNDFKIEIANFSHSKKEPYDITKTISITFKYPIGNSIAPTAFDLLDAVTFSKIDSDTINIDCGIMPISPVQYDIYPNEEIQPGAQYKIDFDLSKIRNPYGAVGQDTVISYTFKTRAKNNFSSVSGKLDLKTDTQAYVILTTDKQTYTAKVNPDNTWKLEKVLAGSYRIDIFLDLNTNGKHDNGFPQPFRHAEPYYRNVSNIKIKKGWDTDDVQLIINDE